MRNSPSVLRSTESQRSRTNLIHRGGGTWGRVAGSVPSPPPGSCEGPSETGGTTTDWPSAPIARGAASPSDPDPEDEIATGLSGLYASGMTRETIVQIWESEG